MPRTSRARRQYQLRLLPDVHTHLKVVAAQAETTMSGILEALIPTLNAEHARELVSQKEANA